nr:MAG TPA: hypothetical protein [Caudoviricetes sp.]
MIIIKSHKNILEPIIFTQTHNLASCCMRSIKELNILYSVDFVAKR